MICSHDIEEDLPGGGWRQVKCCHPADILNGIYAGLCYGCAFEKAEAENKRLRNENVNLADSLNYDECILDGSWPQAVEILERALEKAKVLKG